jgi:hypothetical protein
MDEKICGECGLPTAACNALTNYRIAVDMFKRGRPQEASNYAESAKGFYDSLKEARPPRS